MAFLGDGAVNSGNFHEALNMAAAWDLPFIAVCENNMYATETPFTAATKNTHVAMRGQSYGMPGVEVDGDDILAVYEAAGQAIARARRGEGPTLLECLTYRWFGHHVGDPGTSYRPKDEIAAWKARDPVAKLRQQVLDEKVAEAGEFDAIDAEVRKLIDEAAEFSLASPQPDAATALDHVYSK